MQIRRCSVCNEAFVVEPDAVVRPRGRDAVLTHCRVAFGVPHTVAGVSSEGRFRCLVCYTKEE